MKKKKPLRAQNLVPEIAKAFSMITNVEKRFVELRPIAREMTADIESLKIVIKDFDGRIAGLESQSVNAFNRIKALEKVIETLTSPSVDKAVKFIGGLIKKDENIFDKFNHKKLDAEIKNLFQEHADACFPFFEPAFWDGFFIGSLMAGAVTLTILAVAK